MGPEPKSELKETDLVIVTIRFAWKNEHSQKRTSKLDEEWRSYAHLILYTRYPIVARAPWPSGCEQRNLAYNHLMFTRQSGILLIFCQLMATLSKCFEIWTSNLFCLAFTLTLMYKPILKSIGPKLAILSPKIIKRPYIKIPFCPSLIHQKVYSSFIFQWICLKLSESM